MKTKKTTNAKFSLEKFEIAKLKNMYLVRGGADGNDPKTTTGAGGIGGGSSRDCL